MSTHNTYFCGEKKFSTILLKKETTQKTSIWSCVQVEVHVNPVKGDYDFVSLFVPVSIGICVWAEIQ